MIFISVLLFNTIVSFGQLNISKECKQSKTTVLTIGSNKITNDPKLGYLLEVKGSEIYYFISLGKTKKEASETLNDLKEIADFDLFVYSSMFNSEMFIYGDKLTTGKKIVRFKSPAFSGSAYISSENLEKFILSF